MVVGLRVDGSDRLLNPVVALVAATPALSYTHPAAVSSLASVLSPIDGEAAVQSVSSSW